MAQSLLLVHGLLHVLVDGDGAGAGVPSTKDATAAPAARRFQGCAGALVRSVCSDSTSAAVAW